jgi:uncharacterized membrane protein YcgQ (UPF0703/DUF1980 family)
MKKGTISAQKKDKDLKQPMIPVKSKENIQEPHFDDER